MTLIRITAPHFCVGIVVGVRAAPIVGYMRTWSRDRIVAYCSSRGWTVDEVTVNDLAVQSLLL